MASIVIGLGTFALTETLTAIEIPGVTLALLSGFLLGALARPDAAGAAMVVKYVLPVAIVLIGLRISYDSVRELGLETLALVFAALFVGLGGALAVARGLRVPSRLGILVGIGTAVCGNTAIVAAAPIIRARRNEIIYAVATITAFGTAAVLVLPPIGHAIGLDDTQFGIWSGLGVNDTSQVVATGFAYSDTAGETATVVKLVRNAFLGPILIGLALLSTEARRTGGFHRLRPTLGIPLYVWGFVATAGLASLGAVQGGVITTSSHVSNALVFVVMAAVGLSTRVREIRAAGLRPLIVGLVAMTCLSMVVLAAILSGIGS